METKLQNEYNVKAPILQYTFPRSQQSHQNSHVTWTLSQGLVNHQPEQTLPPPFLGLFQPQSPPQFPVNAFANACYVRDRDTIIIYQENSVRSFMRISNMENIYLTS